MKLLVYAYILGCLLISQLAMAQMQTEKWSLEKTSAWQVQQPWYVGSNFLPSTAINQLEMWQAETFDTSTISLELKWASTIGMNCARVFLHDLLYMQDPKGFFKRMDTFLSIANRYGIKIIFVFFDSVWDPYPYLGKQRDPRPGVHNSGWVQSPGKHALLDTTQYPRLETYVKAVLKRFAHDKRIVCWDLWNEPDNMNGEPYRSYEPANKTEIVAALLEKEFQWFRAVNPDQPATSGVWWDFDVNNITNPIVKVQLSNSDIITFHNYGNAESFSNQIRKLSVLNRPLICTEFMARGNGSTFEAILPVALKQRVGSICWGLVDGKSNTIHDWNTWQKPDKGEPTLWHHDVFRKNGTPYSTKETDLIKSLTNEYKNQKK